MTQVTKTELKNSWITNPNEAEIMVSQARLASESGQMNRWIKEFELEAINLAYRNNGVRIIGEGLMHSLQTSSDIIEVKSIFGIISGTPANVVNEITTLTNNPWLKELFETKEVQIWSNFYFSENVKIALEEKMFNLDQTFLRKTPDFALAAVINFIWSMIVENPGEIENVIVNNKGIVEVYTTKSGKFVGEKGRNINKISAIIGRKISTFSLD